MPPQTAEFSDQIWLKRLWCPHFFSLFTVITFPPLVFPCAYTYVDLLLLTSVDACGCSLRFDMAHTGVVGVISIDEQNSVIGRRYDIISLVVLWSSISNGRRLCYNTSNYAITSATLVAAVWQLTCETKTQT